MDKYLVIISDGADACGTQGTSANVPAQYATAADLELLMRKLAASSAYDDVTGCRKSTRHGRATR
jgi:hypothetical protein